MTENKYTNLTEEQLLSKQRIGARITATVVGLIALSVFLFTLFMKGN